MIHLSATATAAASGRNKMANSITTQTFATSLSLSFSSFPSSSPFLSIYPTVYIHLSFIAPLHPSLSPIFSKPCQLYFFLANNSVFSFSLFLHPSLAPSGSLRHRKKMCTSSENYNRSTAFPTADTLAFTPDTWIQYFKYPSQGCIYQEWPHPLPPYSIKCLPKTP